MRRHEPGSAYWRTWMDATEGRAEKAATPTVIIRLARVRWNSPEANNSP